MTSHRARVRRKMGTGMALVAALLAGAPPAHADGSLAATRFVAVGGSVTVRYLGGSSAHFNTMQWFRIGPYGAAGIAAADADGSIGGGVEDLFYSRDGWNGDGRAVSGAAAGSTVALGGGYRFAAGESVLLGLLVQGQNDEPVLERLGVLNRQPGLVPPTWTWFSGAGAFNPDGALHLRVRQTGADTWTAGWEDLHAAGDGDYDDVMFEITGVTVTPEPVSLALMATGLAGMAGAALRRRRRREDDEEGTRPA